MNAKYGPVPVTPVAPLIVTFETTQERQDFLWLISYDVTIPSAIAAQAAPGSNAHERARLFIKALQRATAEVIKG